VARVFASASSEHISLGSATALEITGNITIFGWIKTTATAEQVWFGCYRSTSPFTGWGVGVNVSSASSGKLAYWSNGSGAWRLSSGTVNSGAWRAVGVVINWTGAGAGTFYIDGSASGTFTHTAPGASGATKYLGRSILGNYYNGSLADVAVWNSNLSAANMASLGAGVSPPTIRPDALVYYYKGQDNDGDVDWWGQLNGTAVNTPTYEQHPPIIYPGGLRVVMPAPAAPAGNRRRRVIMTRAA
jgi:hypothetical protein